MLQHTTPATTTTSNTSAMTPGEALAILHRLNEVVGWHLYREESTQEEQKLRKQVWTALRTLCITVQARPHLG